MKRILTHALVLIAGFAGGVFTTRSIAIAQTQAVFDKEVRAHSLTPVDLNGRLKNSLNQFPCFGGSLIRYQRPDRVTR